MNFLSVICAFAFVGASTANELWMEMMSMQVMAAADSYQVQDLPNIPAKAQALGLTDLVTFVKDAGLAEALSGKGPLTVFGPTNNAFGKLPAKVIDFLKKNTTVLGELLKFHVAAGKVLSTDLKNEELVPSLEGPKIRINIYEKKNVITANGRKVVEADQEASNGVIHVVNGVMFPAPGTLADIVTKCPAFSILLTAAKAADLTGTLAGAGPYTLFAPTDKAFKAIPEKCLKKLLANKKLLKQVLLYHVVAGTQYSEGLSCGDVVETAEGSSVVIKKLWGHIKVNDACVVFPDVSSTNGVMHAINRVLFPKEMDGFCPEGALDYVPDEEPMKDFPLFH